MTEISALEALRYAIDGEMLKLYGVLAVGWVLTVLGQFAGMRPGLVVTLLGIVVFLVGVVAVAYKVLVESRPA